jgi:hypothetical protein
MVGGGPRGGGANASGTAAAGLKMLGGETGVPLLAAYVDGGGIGG